MKDSRPISSEWQTPQWLFDEISREHGPFDIDLCANKENSKCSVSYCKDYLNNVLSDEGKISEYMSFIDLVMCEDVKTAFMNPPYSNPKPFIKKAWEDSKYCKIVCLVKADPSTKWWAVFWEYKGRYCVDCRIPLKKTFQDWYCSDCCVLYTFDDPDFHRKYSGPKPGCEVRFFPKRIQFDPPQQLIDSGEVWKVGPKDCIKCRGKGEFISCNPNERYPIPCFECPPKSTKWVQKCFTCYDNKPGYYILTKDLIEKTYTKCHKCNGKGYTAFSGPTFPSALLIFDRRGL